MLTREDCDGVLWAGNEALPGVVSVLKKLRTMNKKIVFVTNNASKSRRLLLERFEQLGIDASVDEVFSSAYASALYLKNVLKLPEDRKVYLIGMHGLEEELDNVAISHLGGTVRCARGVALTGTGLKGPAHAPGHGLFPAPRARCDR